MMYTKKVLYTSESAFIANGKKMKNIFLSKETNVVCKVWKEEVCTVVVASTTSENGDVGTSLMRKMLFSFVKENLKEFNKKEENKSPRDHLKNEVDLKEKKILSSLKFTDSEML